MHEVQLKKVTLLIIEICYRGVKMSKIVLQNVIPKGGVDNPPIFLGGRFRFPE